MWCNQQKFTRAEVIFQHVNIIIVHRVITQQNSVTGWKSVWSSSSLSHQSSAFTHTSTMACLRFLSSALWPFTKSITFGSSNTTLTSLTSSWNLIPLGLGMALLAESLAVRHADDNEQNHSFIKINHFFNIIPFLILPFFSCSYYSYPFNKNNFFPHHYPHIISRTSSSHSILNFSSLLS